MTATLKDEIARVIDMYQRGDYSRSDVLVFVGMDLADQGSPEDIALLPEWLRQDLFEWKTEFEQSQQWLLVSNAGGKDVTEAGKKLLALLQQYVSRSDM